MASATETDSLLDKDSSGGIPESSGGISESSGGISESCKQCIGRLALVIFIILLVFQIVGVFVYCVLTVYCGIKEKHSHYNCKKGPEIIGIGQRGAMILELTVVCSQLVIRAIFISCGFKLLIKRGPIRREFLTPLCKLSQTLPFLATFLFCVIRFVLILIDDDDLGEELAIAKTTNAMYVTDAFALTVLVTILHFVKLKDLARDNNKKLCRVCGIPVTKIKKRLVAFYLFKCLVFSFWLQYVIYVVVASFQLAFGIFDVDKKFVGEDQQKAIHLLKRAGQLTFLTAICVYLWSKLYDDNKFILGTRTDEGDSMSVSDQSSFVELSLTSSNEYFTASGSSFNEAMQTPQ